MHKGLIVGFAVCMASPAFGDPGGPSLPEGDELGAISRAKAVDAYVSDCQATFKGLAWEYEEEKKVAECLMLDIEQNCSPDSFGCYGDMERCQRDCQPRCTDCQSTCAGSCDDCKSACDQGDRACLRKCAEARADCRGRCLKGLRQCQDEDCSRASKECMAQGAKRVKGCDSDKCDAYFACLDSDLDGGGDWEEAMAACTSKLEGIGDFCERVCLMERGIPAYYEEEEYAVERPSVEGARLAQACTAGAKCPDDYARAAPYLASFCAGTTTDESLELLGREVRAKNISRRTLSLVFNVYGAMYGYQFKREKWMNDFFYGANAAWLPKSCRGKIKTVASARKMPFHLTRLRDRVKRIWNTAPR